MEKVEIIVSGRRALVPADKAKLVKRKQELVAKAIKLEENEKLSVSEHYRLTCEIYKKISRLSRQIGPCVQFI